MTGSSDYPPIAIPDYSLSFSVRVFFFVGIRERESESESERESASNREIKRELER